MLRISGIVAFVLSALAATLLFSRLHSLELSGVAAGYYSESLMVELRDRPGFPRPSSVGMFFFPAERMNNADDQLVRLIFGGIDGSARHIPQGSEVRMSSRLLLFKGMLVRTILRRPYWIFEGTRIASGGRTYGWETSIPMLYTGLISVSLAPLLLWSMVAAAMRFGRPRA